MSTRLRLAVALLLFPPVLASARPVGSPSPALRGGPAHAHLVGDLARSSSSTAALPNDNRIAAGRLADGVLTLRLEARAAEWRPEDTSGVALPVFGFAEVGKPVTVPGPMIRVPAGTELHVTVHNALPLRMRLRGLQDHASTELDSTVVAAGATQDFRFRADVPGTYYYWARTDTFPALTTPGVRRDAALLGAFIVDPAGTRPPAGERVLLLSVWVDTLAALGIKSERADRVLHRELIARERWFLTAINGRSWPYTERLAYSVGDTIRWRVINGSGLPHPMHLHGFYFDVNARGDAQRDTVFTAARRRQAVTEWMPAGTTMAMTWVPTRPGNWVYHCHLVTHIAETLRLNAPAERPAMGRHANHAESGMSGLVMGIRVAPTKVVGFAPDPVAGRKLRVHVTERANVYGDQPGFSYVLEEGATPPAADSLRTPSSTIVLREGEPTEITVVNHARDMASIHWHGIELESFYDGVGDWSGWGSRVAPPIAPGDSFVVRLTPRRAGTFIYHAHTNETTQIVSGLYGTLLVLPRNAPRDTTERVFLLGIGGPRDDARPVVNGAATPPPVELHAGVAHRFRIINISPLESHTVQLVAGKDVQQWRALAKDGADLPPQQATARPATLAVHPGETYDFEVLRKSPETLTLRITSPETTTNRLAARARGVVREALPRIVTEIPVVVR